MDDDMCAQREKTFEKLKELMETVEPGKAVGNYYIVVLRHHMVYLDKTVPEENRGYYSLTSNHLDRFLEVQRWIKQGKIVRGQFEGADLPADIKHI